MHGCPAACRRGPCSGPGVCCLLRSPAQPVTGLDSDPRAEAARAGGGPVGRRRAARQLVGWGGMEEEKGRGRRWKEDPRGGWDHRRERAGRR